MENKGVNMTTGTPWKVILKFWLPVFLGNVAQQIYQLVDAAVVGKYVGSDALAAVGSTAGMTFVTLGVIWGITAGFTVITSQLYGEDNPKGVKRSVGNAIVLSCIITIGMTIILSLLLPTILRLVNTQAGLWDYTYDYMSIIIYGLIATLLYNMSFCLLRAIGESRITFIVFLISNVLNIGLDFLFVLPLGMKVKGVAIATILAQGIAGLFCTLYILKKVPQLHPEKDDWKLDKKMAKDELVIGIPISIQYAIVGVGIVAITAALNLMEEINVTAYSLGAKIESLIEQGPTALGTAMATFTAQNTGAKKFNRIRQGAKAANMMMLIYALTVGLGIAFGGKYLTGLFVNNDVDKIAPMIDTFMKIIGFTIMCLGVLVNFRNIVQGLGYGNLSMIGGVLELITRLVIAYFVAKYLNFAVLCTGYPAAWVASGTFFVIMYFVLLKRKERQFREVVKNAD